MTKKIIRDFRAPKHRYAIQDQLQSSELREYYFVSDEKALRYTQHASLMLLLVTQSEKNRRIIPSKTFEYMRTGKLILAFGTDDGEAARIITETNTGVVINYNNVEKIHNSVFELFNSWKRTKLANHTKKNKGILIGKLFEYLATGNFIVGIGPKHGDAAEILKKSKTGKMFEFNEIEKIKKEIERQYKNLQNGIKPKVNKEEIRKYSRGDLTKELVSTF